MWSILHMTPWSLRTAVTPDTVKIWKKNWHFRVRAWNFLQNGMQNFVIRLIHSWEMALQCQNFNIFGKTTKKGSGTYLNFKLTSDFHWCKLAAYSSITDGWLNAKFIIPFLNSLIILSVVGGCSIVQGTSWDVILSL